MYQMLSTSPFHLPSDPGPQAIYYGARVPILNVNGDPELDATGNPTYVPVPALNRATQATINADFVLRRNYWLSYLNIKRARYNVLDETINDAFKFSPDPNLCPERLLGHGGAWLEGTISEEITRREITIKWI